MNEFFYSFVDSWLLPAAALVVCLLVWLIYRRAKRVQSDRLAVGAAVVIASAFSAEGMFEVATDALKLPWYIAVGLFAVAEAAMLAEAVRARRLHTDTGHLGRHGRAVWAIAVAAGLVVSLNSKSLVEFPIRLGLPILVAALWWLGYQGHGVKPAGAITWTLSPRRVLVWCKLAEPGERDVIQVDRDRRIAALTVTAHRLHHGRKSLRGWRNAKLRRLALVADDEMVAEVRRRIDRVHRVQELTAPASTGPGTENPAASTAPLAAREPAAATATEGMAGPLAGTGELVAGTDWEPELWRNAVTAAWNYRQDNGTDVRVDDIQALGIGRGRAVALRKEVLTHLKLAAESRQGLLELLERGIKHQPA